MPEVKGISGVVLYHFPFISEIIRIGGKFFPTTGKEKVIEPECIIGMFHPPVFVTLGYVAEKLLLLFRAYVLLNRPINMRIAF